MKNQTPPIGRQGRQRNRFQRRPLTQYTNQFLNAFFKRNERKKKKSLRKSAKITKERTLKYHRRFSQLLTPPFPPSFHLPLSYLFKKRNGIRVGSASPVIKAGHQVTYYPFLMIFILLCHAKVPSRPVIQV